MDYPRFIAEVRKREPLWNRKYTCMMKEEKAKMDKLWAEVAKIFRISKDKAKLKWRSLRDTFVKMHRIAKSNGEAKSNWVHYDSLSFLLDRTEFYEESPKVSKKSNHKKTASPSIITLPISEDTFRSVDEASTLSQKSFTNMRREKQQKNLNNSTRSPIQIAHGDGPPPLIMIEPKVTNSSFTNIKRVYALQDEESDESSSPDDQQYSYRNKRVALESNHSEVQTNKETADNENLTFFRSLLPFMRKFNTVQLLRTRIRFQEILLDEFTI